MFSVMLGSTLPPTDLWHAVRFGVVMTLLALGGVSAFAYVLSLVPVRARRLLIVALALAVLAGGALVLAQPAGGINPPFPGPCCPQWFPFFCLPPWAC